MIPRVFYFIYLYSKDSPMNLNINHYICIKSHLVNNEGTTATILTNDVERFYEFPWMSKLVNEFPTRIYLETVERLTDWKGQKIVSPMQESDILRFSTLLERGGVYCDMDMLSVRAIPENFWNSEKCIQAYEPYRNFYAPRGLGSAFIMAPEPKNNISEEGEYNNWLEVILHGYKYYNTEIKKGLYELPIFRPYRLSKLFGHLVNVVNYNKFFPMYFYYDEVENFFLLDKFNVPGDCYEIHLWENRTKGLMKYLSENYFNESNTTYARLGRKYLEEV